MIHISWIKQMEAQVKRVIRCTMMLMLVGCSMIMSSLSALAADVERSMRAALGNSASLAEARQNWIAARESQTGVEVKSLSSDPPTRPATMLWRPRPAPARTRSHKRTRPYMVHHRSISKNRPKNQESINVCIDFLTILGSIRAPF